MSTQFTLKGFNMKVNLDSIQKHAVTIGAPGVNEIHKLLRTRMSIVWSWGARSWTNVQNKALAFRVDGFKHKGNVVIWVNGSDYYDVELVNIRGRSIEMKTDIFFDDLINAIDGMIEKTETYDEDVTNFMEEVLCD